MIPQKASTRGRASSAPGDSRMTLDVVGVVAREPVVIRAALPSLVVALEGSSVDVAAGAQRIVLDRTGCLVLPHRARATLRGAAAASNRVAVLGFAEPLFGAVVRHYKKLGLDRTRLEKWLGRTELLARTVWIHEIVHRYVFERVALDEHDNLSTRFLEIEILKEIYFLFRDRERGEERESAGHKYSPAVERAIGWIEAHLFEPCGVAALAARVGASESTLLRSFRRELGCRPGEYWRTRRLDEALVLVRAGRYSVAEVATRVGYDNPTSFAHAFRQRFGRPPSAFQPRRPTRRSPS
jgi:AraC-like DNA-binding protein